jgi:hypothetical protein
MPLVCIEPITEFCVTDCLRRRSEDCKFDEAEGVYEIDREVAMAADRQRGRMKVMRDSEVERYVRRESLGVGILHCLERELVGNASGNERV